MAMVKVGLCPFCRLRRCGEIGRRKGLKIPRWQHRTGSSPVTGTTVSFLAHERRLSEVMNNDLKYT